MNPIHVDGYETVAQGPHTVLIRPEWKGRLLEDLLDDFRRVDDARRRVHDYGRVAHFSYQPDGAPERVFVRRARRGGAIGALLGGAYFRLSRPLRELQAAAVARRAGVSVPEPVALRATRVAGAFWRFTVVTREVLDASNLLTLAPTLEGRLKRSAIERVADELRRLHAAGVYHGDLTLKNILINPSGVYIIDLDKARLAGGRVESLDVMNLSRLNRSVEKCLGHSRLVSRVDKLRFLRRYLGGTDRLKELALVCGSGLWFHRVWWLLTGRNLGAARS